MNVSQEYKEKIGEFISEYIDINDTRYKYSHDIVIKQSIKLLINNGIFTVKELKTALLKEKNIILHNDFISEV